MNRPLKLILDGIIGYKQSECPEPTFLKIGDNARLITEGVGTDILVKSIDKVSNQYLINGMWKIWHFTKSE